MASIAQINANRENAKLSTGPTTEDGVADCKLNALKYGLTAQQIVIKGEDPAAYDALRADLNDTWDPSNEIEAMLVEQLAKASWKLQHADRVESQIVESLGGLAACFTDDKAVKKYNNFMRHRNTIERAWNRAYAELKRLAALRARMLNRAAMSAHLAAPRPAIGSVLSKAPQHNEDLALRL